MPWLWTDDNGDIFSDKSLRHLIVVRLNTGNYEVFKWVKWILKKVNCFIWHSFKDRIVTASNLIKRGIIVTSTCCPFCCEVEEDINHFFFHLQVLLYGVIEVAI
uniref:Reverse transcriptase zinc-binding domain-containing protein n=1 Tax=Lactuca sativa TaxID=4236 RepID=A0A9R1VY85_LACSA|nr:hypothetical protein LSAT_V11C400165140 [Lactuca sativa]